MSIHYIQSKALTRRRKGQALTATLLIALFFLCLPSPGIGNGAPFLRELAVTTTQKHLALFAAVSDAFSPRLRAGVAGGIPAEFTFYVELYRELPQGGRQRLDASRIVHRLSYDPLKEQYQVVKEESDRNPFTTRGRDAAEEETSRISGHLLYPLHDLENGMYSVRCKVRLEKKTLPLGLRTIIPLMAFLDTETEWQSTVFHVKK